MSDSGLILFILKEILKYCKIRLFADDALIYIAEDEYEKAISKIKGDFNTVLKQLIVSFLGKIN